MNLNFPGTSDWRCQERTLVFDKPVRSVTFLLQGFRCAGKVWFDGIALETLGSGTGGPSGSAPAPCRLDVAPDRVTLENEFLRAVVSLQGGRMVSLVDKRNGRDYTSSGLVMDVTLVNTPEAMAERYFTFRHHNGVRTPGEKMLCLVPTSQGVSTTEQGAVADIYHRDVVAGWAAAIGKESRSGLRFTVDYGALDFFYNWFGQETTLEYFFKTVKIGEGRKWYTRVGVMPLDRMSVIDGLAGDTAVRELYLPLPRRRYDDYTVISWLHDYRYLHKPFYLEDLLYRRLRELGFREFAMLTSGGAWSHLPAAARFLWRHGAHGQALTPREPASPGAARRPIEAVRC